MTLSRKHDSLMILTSSCSICSNACVAYCHLEHRITLALVKKGLLLRPPWLTESTSC